MKPLIVYTVVPPKASASFYYRLEVPLETARDLGLPVRGVIDTHDVLITPQERARIFCESDLVLLYQPIGDQPIQNTRGIQSFVPSKRDGEWKWPPSLVIDSDDNIFNVSPLNTAYRNLGIRDMEGKDVPLGHRIGVVKNGEREVLWEDGVNGFSIARNRQTIASYKTMLELADAVTCSTPGVEQAVRRELVPRRTRVFPNMVRLDHYEQVDLAEDPKRLKVLWQGGIAHYEDWYPLRQALGNLTQKYPEVHWILWGTHYPWVTELIPSDRLTFLPWRPYHEYKLRLAMIGHDISLAPLQQNRFNVCRSAIKFYEASVLKKPAATLAQRAGTYPDEIVDEETGLLFDTPEQFESQLARLIEDAMLRKRLAANAKDWVAEKRDAMKLTPGIVEFWESLRSDRKREQPCFSDEHWAEIEKEAEAEMDEEAKDGALHPVDP